MGGTQNYLISGRAMHAGLVCPRLEKKRSLLNPTRGHHGLSNYALASSRDRKVILDRSFCRRSSRLLVDGDKPTCPSVEMPWPDDAERSMEARISAVVEVVEVLLGSRGKRKCLAKW